MESETHAGPEARTSDDELLSQEHADWHDGDAPHRRGRCPRCGAALAAIVATGPGTHKVDPCGHRLPRGGDA